ncbi:putative ribosomal RNA methyltransferase NOP2-like [Tropilaelaps mercedesae]|uniref:Putative ribosomal RNA methyltransferase NOP2-like n=1 Tax=Tropilaelaps mercedesae TaxID=418985 RepID=A0A1V9X5I6_9ACAR|nr:putative ribosomal RNA methyltransferase NOP2-like [Tropilaelaps mercedesae]
MGRKANYDEKRKRGKGRKSRVQPPPPLPKQLKPEKEDKKLSRHQLKRLRKRQLEGRTRSNGVKVRVHESRRQAAHQSENDSAHSEAELLEEEERKSVDTDESMGKAEAEPRGYTDENKNWLTLKANKLRSPSKANMTLFDNDGSEDEGVMADDFAMDSDKNEDHKAEGVDTSSTDGEEMDVEKQAKKLLKKRREDAELEKAELEDTKGQVGDIPDDFHLPSAEEVIHEQEHPPDLSTIQQRMKDVLYVLADFTHRAEPGRPRRDYLEQLSRDFCSYYSYNDFLMERLMQLFAPAELAEFLEANQVPRPVTVRTNTLKTRRRELAQALLNRGVNLDPLGEWSREGLVIYNSQVPIGATPEYLAGHYILQGAASMLPVLSLAPREGERVLDLCAAPGGKTAHIAALMKNTGILFANDVQPERCKAIIANLHRLGVTNAVVSAVDGRKYSKIMTGFDRVLVDAPCSGSGVMSKDERVKTSKDAKDILRCAHLQRELLLAAIDCVDAASDSGACVVYSTCSVLPEENECVVDYALKHRHVEIIDSGLKFGREGLPRYREYRFAPQMSLARRKSKDDVPASADATNTKSKNGKKEKKTVGNSPKKGASPKTSSKGTKKPLSRRRPFSKNGKEPNVHQKDKEDGSVSTGTIVTPVKSKKFKGGKRRTSGSAKKIPAGRLVTSVPQRSVAVIKSRKRPREATITADE